MAENEESKNSSGDSSRLSVFNWPKITLPPRSSTEAFFSGPGFSPGPMTLVSNFFSDSDDCKSFSQLLAGAMASPAGLSPVSLLDSPGFLSPTQGAFGMTHQQALAGVNAQASQAQSELHNQPENSSDFLSEPGMSMTQMPLLTSNTSMTANQEMQPLMPDTRITVNETSDPSYSDKTSQSSTFWVDRPAGDGYNWRKYGQKQVKGSKFPRSYYKCTYPNCPVKKRVERSLEGQVTEIIHKGEHNHERPQSKRSKDTGNLNLHTNNQGMSRRDQESRQPMVEHQSGSSDSEEEEDTETGVDEKDEDEPDPKRRGTEVRISEAVSSHRTVMEPKIIVQTTSEVDLLDDGYRWRKYGQKVVKGNHYPRSYYKCTTQRCSVRKHVERASTDRKAVITTYEGKHNHDVPAAKSSSHNIVSSSASQLKPQTAVTEKYTLMNKTELGATD